VNQSSRSHLIEILDRRRLRIGAAIGQQLHTIDDAGGDHDVLRTRSSTGGEEGKQRGTHEYTQHIPRVSGDPTCADGRDR